MKTRKYIKIASLLFLTSLFFWSCEEDDSVANDTFLGTPTQVNVEFTDTNDGAETNEDGDSVALTVGLSEALSYDTILTMAISSSDGDVASGEVTGFTETTTIAAGETSAVFTLAFPDDSVSDTSETYTISIANLESSDGSYPNDVYLYGSDTTRTINVVLPATIVETIAGDLTFSAAFAPGADIDLFGARGMVTDGPGLLASTLFDVGTSVSNPEVIMLADAEADGDYTLFIRDFNGGYPVDVELTLDFAGGEQEVFNLVVDDAAFPGVIDGDIKLFVNKATDGAVVTYTITLN